MSNVNRRLSVRRNRHDAWRAGIVVLVGAVALACGGTTTGSPRPSQSLELLDFTPPPTIAPPSVAASRTPAPSSVEGEWPSGWDVAFCTAFQDSTVAHELVIDIERAIADKNPSDAEGLSNELAQTAPVASNEINKLRNWDPAADVKASLLSLLDLDSQAADAYQSYFKDGVKSALHDARQLRNQVRKAVPDANTQLAALAALGVSCPGATLKLETF